MKGRLFLIPAPLGDGHISDVIPAGTIEAISSLTHFAVEEFRSARRYLSKAGFKGRIDSLQFFLLNEHTKAEETFEIIELLNSGTDVGLISEAGLPAVADPGSNLVESAHRHNIEVKPLTGPSSIFLALMASGKNGQNFAFIGYLPAKTEERRLKIKELEKFASRSGQSQIMIETPYRNDSLLSDFLQICSDSTMLTIASEITCENQFIKTKSIGEWKRHKPELNKKPCVFIL
ncbi:MAG: SAM-dependent methyltransferase [Bacteroidetes bacterium GWE2_39_28]|nr:MAG: SAM-dependent methyltransferase [Bacteroidetes bacterium GWE2_39_28]OFY15190.1 MAG: SAM-dependent methyltransferase [Bacteroidetes bacterium GWF2_39_10]OFZ09186.1 MAG: SAM-dependent methyltransferase [Bacteroidetes bacterium RIFOXYB2_FULL_39_7]OFZ09791.1 MAG: SAM-dependent methyltransferase [Bacteroidetes bacterium RIFOXYC2_FULL_39_11]HCT93814.1 SAM-dependent methyltransferase [Rikenellaceae bacterium]